MATRAVVLCFTKVDPSGEAGVDYQLQMDVDYFDISGAISTIVPIRVGLLWTDTGAQILSKITTAIVDGGTTLGYTVARTDTFIPSYQKGS